MLEPEDDVPARASAAIERLSTAIAAAEQPSDEVFELYSAASKADREARSPVDHIGALLLAQHAAALLEGRDPQRRCFFDPRHRRAVTDTRWRLGDEETEVPSCRRCERALKAGRMPDTLGDRGKPYFERDSVWARTGFGTIDDELAARVLVGAMTARGKGSRPSGKRGRGARSATRRRARAAALLAALLLGGLVAAGVAQANRLDDAGAALSQPGVWVHDDLAWLVEPARAQRLTRRIRAARMPLRIAVLPMLEVDESRGDPRAIARSILGRVDSDGLLVLVDEDGRMEYAARDLPLQLSEYSVDSGLDLDTPLDERIDAIVARVGAARGGPPQTFEPYSDPEGVSRSTGGSNEDPLAGVAFASALFGALLGGALYCIMRAIVWLVFLLSDRKRA